MKTIEALTDLVVLGEDEEFVSVEAAGITGRVNLFIHFHEISLSLGFGKYNINENSKCFRCFNANTSLVYSTAKGTIKKKCMVKVIETVEIRRNNTVEFLFSSRVRGSFLGP